MLSNIRGNSGQAMVELAIALPLFFLIIFGMIQYGMIFHDYLTVSEIAREGARIAAVGGDLTAAGLTARITDMNIIYKTVNPAITATPTIVNTSLGIVDAVKVTVTVQPSADWSALPFVGDFVPSQLQGSVTMRLE